MPVLFLKMLDGEEVVSEATKSEAGYVLTNPAKLMLSHQGLGMMPYNPFVSDKSITLPESFVVYTATPEDEIRNAYNEKYGSGIVTAPAGLILG